MKFSLTLLMAVGMIFLPTSASAISRVIHAEWEYQYNNNAAGFRLYHENKPVCEVNDPNATSINCTVDVPDGESWFTLTTFFQDGTESPHSEPFTYIFSSTLKAALTADNLTGETPLPVTFDATSSTGDIVSYEWLFGDGDSGFGSVIAHTFTTAGSYTVTLKVTDDTGAVDRETVSVAVTSASVVNAPPTAVISTSTSVGDAPLQVKFDATGSSDSDGSILLYKWAMGDGGTADGPQFTYTYTTAGTFTATLTVTDDGGLTDTISTPVIVRQPVDDANLPPTAAISASPIKGAPPLAVSFDGDGSKDPDGTVSSYTWNFGDGTTDSGIAVKHTFIQPAVYTVTLKVTDNMGAESQTVRYSITVQKSDQKLELIPEKIRKSLVSIINLLLKNSPETEVTVEKE